MIHPRQEAGLYLSLTKICWDSRCGKVGRSAWRKAKADAWVGEVIWKRRVGEDLTEKTTSFLAEKNSDGESLGQQQTGWVEGLTRH